MPEDTTPQPVEPGVEPAPEPAPEPQIDQAKLDRFLQELEAGQNLGLGILGGAVAALIGAAIWAAVTVATNYQIGWMAVGVGFLVGYAVRLLGKGISKVYGIVGAVLALVGCLLGNFLSFMAIVAREEGMSLFELLPQVNPAGIPSLMAMTFQPMDLLFYAIAVYEGYRFSFVQISEEQIAGLIKSGE